MTREQKQRLARLAKAYIDCNPEGVFISGAQTILDNPSEWGLYPNFQDKEWASTVNGLMDENQYLKSQLSRYRETLERIETYSYDERYEDPSRIAKEALKQQDDENSN